MNLSNSRLLAVSLVLASTLAAQTKSASFNRTYGPTSPNANVNVDLLASTTKGLQAIAKNGSPVAFPYVSAHAHARASVNVLSWSARALAIEGNAFSGFSGSYGSLKVVVAGFTLVNESHAGLYTWANKFGPYQLFASDPEIPVPFTAGLVSVGANIGGGADFTFVTSVNPSTTSLTLGGSGRVYGTGHAKVTAGIFGFGVGLRADLRFLDTTVAPYLSASPTSISGAMNLSMSPLAIALRVFLTLPFAGEVASKQIWNWAAATLERSLVAL